MNAIKIIKPAILATLQDLGRKNYKNIGISTSGVMDEEAYFLANNLLSNPINQPIIEVFYSDFQIQALGDINLVVTGAKVDIKIDDKTIEQYKTFMLKDKQILKISNVKNGMRYYIGFKGDLLLNKEFGSYSTSIKEEIGVFQKALKSGDLLPIKTKFLTDVRALKKQYIPKYEDNLILRVTRTNQTNLFEKLSLEHFLNTTYEVTTMQNRLGYKLKGDMIKTKLKGIISEGICYGAVQIPPEGIPMILLKEAQSIGGYPKIANVISVDCNKLSQAKVGTKVKFVLLNFDEATKVCKNFYKEMSWQ